MEEEKKGIGSGRNLPSTGEQYLSALLKCADWVPNAYKQLAEANKMRPEVLKELYLCACEGVPAQKAAEAQQQTPPEDALRSIRINHIENMAMGTYQEDLSGIKETASKLEKEIRYMSETLKHIAEHVPSFDSMFPEIEQEMILKEDTGLMYEAQLINGKDNVEKQKEALSISESGMLKNNKSFWGKKKSIPDFMEELMKKGFNSEQLNYILKCIEEGVTIKEIRKFASPKLPVDMMERLRKLENRKEQR